MFQEIMKKINHGIRNKKTYSIWYACFIFVLNKKKISFFYLFCWSLSKIYENIRFLFKKNCVEKMSQGVYSILPMSSSWCRKAKFDITVNLDDRIG